MGRYLIFKTRSRPFLISQIYGSTQCACEPDISGEPSTSAARGDDLKCRPFRKIVFSPTVIHSKNENFNKILRYEFCHPHLACAAPNIQLFCPFFKKIL